ncbi:MAG TPA: hypothetical protein VIH90_07320 [Candidatus Saccharimonadales bacterium]
MKIYKIVYTLNDDLKRYFIDFEAEDRKSAIELLMNVGQTCGLNYKIVSCRLARIKQDN